ncbi:hypothetical protein GCM10009544_36560 [Streptomyces stramineus]|uniref:Uncharacterized protein n=1 Tax=Streptomyces stramineus TaxID=173861 RepID=A0ABN1A9S9_9ACTN
MEDGTGHAPGFAVATGAGGAPAGSARERERAVAVALEGLREIRRLTNTRADDPLSVPAAWERHQPVRAVALVLEAAGIPPSAVGADGRPVATGYRVRLTGQPAAVRVEWVGPPGSGAGYEEQAALGRCAAALRRMGWEALEYRGPRRRRYLEVEPAP